MSIKYVPVFIVGGGLVGLSASLFLAHQGIPSLLVERHSGTSIHPRARGLHFRAMEHLREVGLEEEIRQAGLKLAASRGILSGETLINALSTMDQQAYARKLPANTESYEAFSPTQFTRCTQDLMEPILLAKAKAFKSDVRFHTELVSFEQDEGGVTAHIRDRASGHKQIIRTEYMIAADGANSPIREALGIRRNGSGRSGNQINIFFQADLGELVRGREFSICVINQEHLHGMLTAINNDDLWVLHINYHPERGESRSDYQPERCQEIVRAALGLPLKEITIKSILAWESAVRFADYLQAGRIFLAGDAAHQMPPTLGAGASTGMADVHNLAWKLAAVIKGDAASELLATYNSERQPVGQLTAEQSGIRGPLTIAKNVPGYVDDLIVLAGYQYRSQAIISEGDSTPPLELLEFTGQPGTRAPHYWLWQDEKRISTLDLFGQKFVLLVNAEEDVWLNAANGLPINIQPIGQGSNVLDPEAHWQAMYGISTSGAVLVRPDGFVAWRCLTVPENPGKTLSLVFQQITCQRR